jgi:hypothetical protein
MVFEETFNTAAGAMEAKYRMRFAMWVSERGAALQGRSGWYVDAEGIGQGTSASVFLVDAAVRRDTPVRANRRLIPVVT